MLEVEKTIQTLLASHYYILYVSSSSEHSSHYSKMLGHRLDDLILEAIKKLKESSGSNKATIATYIEVSIIIIT
jgi:hypothetical protein